MTELTFPQFMWGIPTEQNVSLYGGAFDSKQAAHKAITGNEEMLHDHAVLFKVQEAKASTGYVLNPVKTGPPQAS